MLSFKLIFAALLSLNLVTAAAAASNLYDVINAVRAGSETCAVTKPLQPLQPQAALERAARELAHGNPLEPSLAAAQYRASQSKVFSIRGEGAGAQATALLARTNHCAQLQDALMTEVGIYHDARQIWVVLAAPFAPSAGASNAEAGRRVLELVNAARAVPRHCGDKAAAAAPPLRWNDTLGRVSLAHSEDMARNSYFSHTARDGSSPAQRVERAGYRYRTTGENIAAGGRMQAEDAVAGWIKSPGHCINLMNPAYTEMGVAHAANANSKMGVYWTQVFGTPR
jgi:uncharacterized protein YkwD